MRIPAFTRPKRMARWLRSRLTGKALVLGYHRVADAAQDPFSMCISPQRFAQHLAVLRELANPVSLSELVESLETGCIPARAVAVTIDDGYADALHQARPLLEEYRVPATVFVTTGCLGAFFWWDRLEQALLSPHTLPDALSLTIDGKDLNWRAGRSSDGASGAAYELLWTAYRHLLPLSAQKRDRALEQLSDWSGVQAQPDPALRALSEQELVALSESSSIDIGAHSLTHPLLADLDVGLQREEIHDSKTQLEALLARPVRHFSYPNGSFSKMTRDLVRDSGFSCACTSEEDVIRGRYDPFRLPRFWVTRQDGAVFSRWLRWWLKG